MTMPNMPEATNPTAFTAPFSLEEREAIYRVIFARRDVRSGFLDRPIPRDVLWRVLDAAHHAGSVGFMQPWNFLVVTDLDLRRRVRDVFTECNARAAAKFEGERATLYRGLKLEGILESGANLAITCDRQRHGPQVLGRDTMRDTDLYSTCCAVQNLWLAARAEGLGVGWVSILETQSVKDILKIPTHIDLIAYLCIGYVESFAARPDLERAGWQRRLSLQEVAFEGTWGRPLQSPPE